MAKERPGPLDGGEAKVKTRKVSTDKVKKSDKKDKKDKKEKKSWKQTKIVENDDADELISIKTDQVVQESGDVVREPKSEKKEAKEAKKKRKAEEKLQQQFAKRVKEEAADPSGAIPDMPAASQVEEKPEDKVTKSKKTSEAKISKKLEKQKAKEEKKKKKEAKLAKPSDDSELPVEARQPGDKLTAVKAELNGSDSEEDEVNGELEAANGAVHTNGNKATGPNAATVHEKETPLFIIDTKPTKVDLSTLRAPPPEPELIKGQSRQVRRRFKLIARQKEIIIKKLEKDGELPAQSAEFNAEAARQLDVWTKDRDQKTELRVGKKKERKAREAQRLRTKRGKLLTGRRLREREKQIKGQEKSKARVERRAAQNDD